MAKINLIFFLNPSLSQDLRAACSQTENLIFVRKRLKEMMGMCDGGGGNH